MKKQETSQEKRKKPYEKPRLTRHKKLTLVTGGIDSRLGCMRF